MTGYKATVLASPMLFFAGACSVPERSQPDAPAAESSPSDPLDGVITSAWRASGVEPTSDASDAEFLRRATLDAIGRVPTREEARAFLAEERPDKRERLVRRLLDSEEYADYWADLYLDLLVAQDPQLRRRVGDPLREWLVDGLEDGRGWDDTAHALLTATGELAQAPQAGFIVGSLREGKIENLTGRTGEIFLGVQIQCAQCHDHPYDEDFSREDFWAMGAFFSRSRVRVRRDGDRPVPRIVDTNRGEMRIEVEGSDRKKKVAPAFMGEAVQVGEEELRREVLSREVRASELFAKAAVGQVWTQLFGRGVVEPWNDLGTDGAAHPELLEALATQFVEDEYDHRRLLERIMSSAAYQRSSVGAEQNRAQAEAAFARAPVRALSPHQLFRSLFSATGIEDVENRKVRRRVRKAKRDAQKQYLFVFGDDEMAQRDAFTGNVPQALLLLNGDLTNQGVVARPGTTLGRILDESDEDQRRIDELYLTIYGRFPSAAERERAEALVEGHGARKGYEDLMFAMLYSSEFLSNH
jgi:hypothetical protein